MSSPAASKKSTTNKGDIAHQFSDLSVAQHSESKAIKTPPCCKDTEILDLCSSSDESDEEKDDFQCSTKERRHRNASAVSSARIFKGVDIKSKKRKLNARSKDFVPMMPSISFPKKIRRTKQKSKTERKFMEDIQNQTPPSDNETLPAGNKTPPPSIGRERDKNGSFKTPSAPKKPETPTSAHIPVARSKPRRLFSARKSKNMLCSTKPTPQQFQKERDQYTSWIFERLNTGAFGDKLVLDDNVSFSWCKTLNKTAGDCRLIQRTRKGRKAHVRLATKILTDLDKLKQTFCHELCHAMAWIVDGVKKPPHGPRFQHWANEAESAFSDIKVTTCHNYQIQYKYQWQCTKCKYIYGRHSKSIKLDKHRCGVCKNKLEFMGKLQADGNYVVPKTRATSAFTVFMRENMASVKRRYPKAKHSDIMKILSEQYKLKQKQK